MSPVHQPFSAFSLTRHLCADCDAVHSAKETGRMGKYNRQHTLLSIRTPIVCEGIAVFIDLDGKFESHAFISVHSSIL